MPEKELMTVSFEQTLSEEEFACAFRALNHCASPWRRRGVRAGLCATAALAVALFLPAYRRQFATAVFPAVLICALLVGASAFFFLQPVWENRKAHELYSSCALMAQPARFTVRADRAEWKNRYESCTEYWTDFLFCAETPTLFVAAGGFQRGVLVMKKSGGGRVPLRSGRAGRRGGNSEPRPARGKETFSAETAGAKGISCPREPEKAPDVERNGRLSLLLSNAFAGRYYVLKRDA